VSTGLTDEVLASFASTPDQRLRTILERVVVHLHELVREVEPTVAEWEAAIGFLTDVGAMCDDTRQEFILLSDVLGVSSLVETLNGSPEGTESTVLGPFHMTSSPVRALGDSIDDVGGGRRALVTGRVVDPSGRPVPGAEIDVWQCTEGGSYDVQQPDVQPAGNGRGLFHADDEGRFRFRTVVPGHYPIPIDGPVGALLGTTRRHPYRPAHVHLLVSSPGFGTLTTHLFVRGSPYLEQDAVFAVKWT
jgi:hydroxyquinol 1,2-dioxygenase